MRDSRSQGREERPSGPPTASSTGLILFDDALEACLKTLSIDQHPRSRCDVCSTTTVKPTRIIAAAYKLA